MSSTQATAVAHKLLEDSKELWVYTREIKLLIDAITDGLIETITKSGDLGDVWQILVMTFVEIALEFGVISGEGTPGL